MTALAPGKLILSGEHAVVHGKPAIAMAINRYARAHIVPDTSSHISFDLLNISYHKSHTISALKELKRRLKDDYQKFLRGEQGIRDVLKKPFELSQFAISRFLDSISQSTDSGFKIKTESDIPLGCGMGSSAAMILSVIHAVSQHLHLEMEEEQYFNYALEAENMQHGRSSGLDLKVSYRGGCLYYCDGKIATRDVPDTPMYLVNTGKPAASTGECVSHTQSFFKHNGLADDFEAVTQHFDNALQANDSDAMRHAFRENHRLLSEIGVVPERVNALIHALEAQGAAAKVCGAGSIAGDAAGAVVILADFDPKALCQRHGFDAEIIQGETLGLHAA